MGKGVVWTILASLLLVCLVSLGCQKGPETPGGLTLSVVEGYQNWPLISVNCRKDLGEIHIILGNSTALEDFLYGIPVNGHPFTDGAVLVRLIYSATPNPLFPQDLVPDHLIGLDFMLKDAQRFKATQGWGYASFSYDPGTRTFRPLPGEKGSQEKCLHCHEKARKRDYIFTSYTPLKPGKQGR